jgi:hypothetical protein
MQKLAPDTLADFIRSELDKVALAHSSFSDDALSLIVRSSEGVLRRAKNLCLGALLEAVRDRTKTVDLCYRACWLMVGRAGWLMAITSAARHRAQLDVQVTTPRPLSGRGARV